MEHDPRVRSPSPVSEHLNRHWQLQQPDNSKFESSTKDLMSLPTVLGNFALELDQQVTHTIATNNRDLMDPPSKKSRRNFRCFLDNPIFIAPSWTITRLASSHRATRTTRSSSSTPSSGHPRGHPRRRTGPCASSGFGRSVEG